MKKANAVETAAVIAELGKLLRAGVISQAEYEKAVATVKGRP